MTFSTEDTKNIKLAMEFDDPWDVNSDLILKKTINNLKSRIKRYLRQKNDRCCYCYRTFRSEHNMVIDLEHVLPQKKYKKYTFELFNIGLSCKRCNMTYKKDKTDFLNCSIDSDTTAQDSNSYKIIHPSFDIFSDNLKVFNFLFLNIEIVKYSPVTPKGWATYDYFHLMEFEIESIDEAQGAEPNYQLSVSIPESIRKILAPLIEKV